MTGPLGKLGKSILRIGGAVALVLGVVAMSYLVWRPGSNAPLPEFPNNAIWLGHGWLGDDDWFKRNHREMAFFRDGGKVSALFQKLRDNGISTVYPHLCPAQSDGGISPCDHAQTELFLDMAAKFGIKVVPWIGGVLGDSARPTDAGWRRNFVASVEELVKNHPRLAGVQVNIEPMPSGNGDFLKLLDELHPVMGGRTLGVAAYPPPTMWQPVSEVHWELPYVRQVASRCDQLAVMMYDTAIPLEKFYVALMKQWTRELSETVNPTGCELILGVPAYEDDGVGYHHPEVENLFAALNGISATMPNAGIHGIAIYCEWVMNEAKWRQWHQFIAR